MDLFKSITHFDMHLQNMVAASDLVETKEWKHTNIWDHTHIHTLYNKYKH